MKIIDRVVERCNIKDALVSQDPELIAVWGRRRVGKTFLIRHGHLVLDDHYFEISGQRQAVTKTQLKNFTAELSKSFYRNASLTAPPDWQSAFRLLADSIDALPADGKPITLFFDEAPWLDSRRSGFLNALEYFWNTVGTRNARLKTFICGSAASWILNKIVNGKGGWHRRVTTRIWIQPFKLAQVAEYMESRNIRLARLDLIKLYMILGGIPFYLNLMKRGESLTTFIERLFFLENAALNAEFDELYDSLFTHSANYKKIVTELAKSKLGYTRSQILAKTRLTSGGEFNSYLDSLEQSGFIEKHLPLETAAGKDTQYRLCDMFTLFHLHWLATKNKTTSWENIIAGQPYKSWCGHAFEIVVWNHPRELIHALGLSKSAYQITRTTLKNQAGNAQIDLVIDVQGGAVYLFEIKFCEKPYTMAAEESAKLLQRRKVLSEHYQGTRSIIVVLLTPCGAERNAQLGKVVDLVLDSDALFATPNAPV